MSRDPIAESRLPDLPNAGYATEKQKALSDVVMFILRDFERDRYLLLTTLIEGRELWRRRFVNAYRWLKADTEFADSCWRWLCIIAGPEHTWEAQKARLDQMHEQHAVRKWDRRFRTVLQQGKDRGMLEQDIVKDIVNRSKHRHTVN